MSATADSLIVDLDMVAVGSDVERGVLDLARAMLRTQADKLAIWEGGIQGDALKALNEAPELKADFGALKAAVLAMSVHVRVESWNDKHTVAVLTELFALVPGAPVGGGS